MMKTIKKSFRDKRGFSLAEVLIAILLVLMMTSIVAAGMPAATNAYYIIVDSANAQTLLSTTMTSMRDELSSAKIESCSDSDKEIVFIGSDGSKTSITSESDGIYINPYLELGASSSAYKRLLVSKAAANKNLYAAFDSIAYVSDNCRVVISGLKVFKDGTNSGPLVTIDKYDIRVIL